MALIISANKYEIIKNMRKFNKISNLTDERAHKRAFHFGFLRVGMSINEICFLLSAEVN